MKPKFLDTLLGKTVKRRMQSSKRFPLKFGSKFGKDCRHKSLDCPSPPKFDIDFQKYKHPEAEEYLGDPIKSTCGYSYDSGCVTGYLFGSNFLKKCESFCMPQIKIRKGSVDIRFSMGEFEMCEHFEESGESEKIWEKVLRELYVNEYSETLYRTFLLKKYPEVGDTYKVWLKTFIPSCKERPSEKHFLVIVRGLLEVYECDLIKFKSYNPSAPKYDRAYWCERWPTKDEVASMILHFRDFYFGVPPEGHLHGN